jgi:XTP/dITP diphosphohydrolase
MKRRILIASGNAGKVAELSAMLDCDAHWVSLSDIEGVTEVEEDGHSFTENSRKKALGYAKQAGIWTIADDSGLMIDALGGEPGIKSARFSGEKEANEQRGLLDHRNMAKVLQLLQGVEPEKRTARFVCHLCLASPEKVLSETEGILEGVITDKEYGENGFGYDPIFFVPAMNKTVAQMSSGEKNLISHRANAIAKLKPLLSRLLSCE